MMHILLHFTIPPHEASSDWLHCVFERRMRNPQFLCFLPFVCCFSIPRLYLFVFFLKLLCPIPCLQLKTNQSSSHYTHAYTRIHNTHDCFLWSFKIVPLSLKQRPMFLAATLCTNHTYTAQIYEQTKANQRSLLIYPSNQ